MDNQKIRGASSQEYNDIKFKSKLEVSCYKKLEQTDFWFKYEPERFVLFTGPRLNTIKLYAPKHISPGRYGKELLHLTENLKVAKKLINITYTPDFEVRIGNIKAYFDVKGKENDVYPMKKKLFLAHLEELSQIEYERGFPTKFMFFEPHSVGHMMQAIEILKKYEEELC